MKRNPKPTNPRRKKIVLPVLSDEALIQIQDFLHLALMSSRTTTASNSISSITPYGRKRMSLKRRNSPSEQALSSTHRRRQIQPWRRFCLRLCLRPSHSLAGVCTTEITAG